MTHSSIKFNKIGHKRDSNPWTDPEGSSRLKLPEFMTNGT